MSCQLETWARIADLAQLKEFLDCPNVENWISQANTSAVHCAISPLESVAVFAQNTKFVFLDRKKDKKYFNITFKGNLDEDITSTIILTIDNPSSSPRLWYCIVLGTTTGRVHFFTEFGNEIFSQQFHTSPVIGLKVGGRAFHEEFHIAHRQCVCIVKESRLLDLLNTVLAAQHYPGRSIQATNITYLQFRKWMFPRINLKDASVIRERQISNFDHLVAVSNENGVNASYKNAPSTTTIISVGQDPFVGFHCANEGFVQPVMTEVAHAVASKVKSFLPTWLNGSSATASDTTPPKQPTDNILLHHGLYDRTRTGQSVCLSPDRQYAAVADNLGRVMLVDCSKGIAVRVWKGYRDAECAFLQVTQPINQPKKQSIETDSIRHALFLVIYAPRRLCLEVWALQRGPKVAVFAVSRGGHLISNPHFEMDVKHKIKQSSSKTHKPPCLFLDANGDFKTISVPFYCALGEGSSVTAKDLHLLNRIQTIIKKKNKPMDEMLDELTTACAGLQADEIRIKCIEFLVKSTSKTSHLQPEMLKAALSVFLDSQPAENDASENAAPTEQSNIRQQMLQMARNYIGLTDFYVYLTDLHSDSQRQTEPLVQLNLSHVELENVQKFVDIRLCVESTGTASKASRVVTFDETASPPRFIDYLAIFNCYPMAQHERQSVYEHERAKSEEPEDEFQSKNFHLSDIVTLLENKDEQFSVVGRQMFGQFLERGKSLSDFVELARASRISSMDLMRLFMLFWLERPFKYTDSADLIVDLTRFTAVLQHICLLSTDEMLYDYNSINNWWQAVREILLQSSHSLQSLMAAMMCRTYATKFYKRDPQNEDCAVEAMEEDVWEQVPQESAEWSLLIDKLDDVAALDAVLTSSLSHMSSRLTALPAMPFVQTDISLGSIVSGGKGIVSEITAKWLISLGMKPTVLLEPEQTETVSADEPMDVTEPTDVPVPDKFEQIFSTHWTLLREHFPFSLQSGVILIHMTWEYLCHWSKDMSNLSRFEAALECLDAIRPCDYSLKNGICCMIWYAHLTIPLKATMKLIDKCGRLPKEALCLQAINLSDSLVADFLELCTKFLHHFVSTAGAPKIDLRFEELLQDGPIPLAELALQQREANAQIVRLQIEMNETLFMIASLNLKVSKPIRCVFNPVAAAALFSEVNRPLEHVIPVPDEVLLRQRTDFFVTVISATMDLIREDWKGQVFLNEHVMWMERVERLSNAWGVSNDKLKLHQVIELYAHCCDDYADEQFNYVLDKFGLGKRLLRIAGRRLINYYTNNSRIYAEVASVGWLLTEFLDKLNETKPNDGPRDISLDRLIALSNKVFTCLAVSDSHEKRVAAELFDACQRLKGLEQLT